jgi:hypothetical protein
MPALDTYDPEVMDDENEFDTMSIDARMEAEAELRRRDMAEGRTHGRFRKGLLYGMVLLLLMFNIFYSL